MSNDTTVCHKHVAPNPPPVFQNGDFHFQTHHIGFILCGTFTIISTVVSAWLISKHLQWYTNKREQRYIVRLLFMVPLYALISFASFYFWNQSTPIVLVRDSYESIVLTAFFYLLLMYLSDDPEEQKRIFLKKGLSKEADRIATQRGLPVEKWCFPLGFLKWKPSDGLYFLQLMKWAVLQYCVIRPTTTLAAVILDSVGLYCESSWNLRWGHAYIVVIVSISVSIAMYCLVQLYVVVAAELAPYRPLMKLFSVKAVVFLTFWQATFLSVLSMVGVIKDTEYMTAEDINIGIGAVIETFEMMLFAFLHILAFTYKPYKEIAIKAAKGRRPTSTPRWRSLGHAMDFRETFREIWIGSVYMFDKMRGKEPKPDFGARRIAHYEVAFGRSRLLQNSLSLHGAKRRDRAANTSKAALPDVEIEVERDVSVEMEDHKQALGLRHDRYGIHPDREKSDGLEDQINHELQKLGYPKLTIELDPMPDSRPPKRLPWWRTVYDHLSQSGQEPERENFIQRRLSHRYSRQNQSQLQRTKAQNRDINSANHNDNISIDDNLPPISLLLPPHRPTSFTQAQCSGPDPGWGHWREKDRHPSGFVSDDHGLTSSRNEMISASDQRTTFFDDGDADIGGNGVRTAYTEPTIFAPVDHHRSLNFGNHDRRQLLWVASHSPLQLLSRDLQKRPYQGPPQVHDHARGQPQPETLAPSPRCSSTILPPVPRGALVFPPTQVPRFSQETEFNPWGEYAQSRSLFSYSDNPDPDPPPPPLPPKDVPSTSSRGQQAPSYLIERSTHRREPALPHSSDSLNLFTPGHVRTQ